jgi:hypothetical protein
MKNEISAKIKGLLSKKQFLFIFFFICISCIATNFECLKSIIQNSAQVSSLIRHLEQPPSIPENQDNTILQENSKD